MAGVGLIVGGGLALAGLLWWSSRAKAATPDGGSTLCAAAGAAADLKAPGTGASVKAACEASKAGAVSSAGFGAIGDFLSDPGAFFNNKCSDQLMARLGLPSCETLGAACPAGTSRVTDNRNGKKVVTCVTPSNIPIVPGPRASTGAVHTTITGSPSNPPPGFHWVPSSFSTPGHWERDAAIHPSEAVHH